MAEEATTQERTWGEAFSDTGVQLAEGVNTVLGAVPNLLSPSGSIAAFFNDNADHWREQQSDALKEKIARADAAISQAGKDGLKSEIGEAARQYFSDPALAMRFVTTNLPSLVPGVGAAKVAQAATLARGATAARAAAVAVGAAGASNAVLNAGGARGDAYLDLKNTLMAQGLSAGQAEEQALKDSRIAAGIGGITGFLSGKTGLEKAVVEQMVKGRVVQAGLMAAAKEFLGEQAEEVLPQIGANLKARQYDGRSATQDVGKTMVATAIGAGPGTAMAGGVTAGRSGRRETGAGQHGALQKILDQFYSQSEATPAQKAQLRATLAQDGGLLQRLDEDATAGRLKGFALSDGTTPNLAGAYDMTTGVVTLPAGDFRSDGAAPKAGLVSSLRVQDMMMRFAFPGEHANSLGSTPKEAVDNLQSAINGSPHLAGQVREAVTPAAGEKQAVLESLALLRSIHAGGEYDSGTRTISLPLSSIAPASDPERQQKNERNLAFVLGYEVQHALNRRVMGDYANAFSAQVREIAAGNNPAPDYTETVGAYLRAVREDEARAQIGGYNALFSREKQVNPGANLDYMARMEELARQSRTETAGTTVDLFYSTKTPDETFIERLRGLARAAGVALHLIASERGGKLDAARLCEEAPGWRDASLWFCGPAGFGQALRHGLVRRGFSVGDFHQELFDMR
ncbi:MAG: hypothetical protein LBE06_03710 [Azoarcus sp.]|nr:hypothetical protein [Azoarcus sp.]